MSENTSGSPEELGGIEPRTRDEEVRIGVYVCHCGGNISDKVEVDEVAEAASKLPDVQSSRSYAFMCSDPGQALIVDDIAEHRLNRVVVASCSPSLHELTFRNAVVRGGVNPFLYEHVNVREQVSWVHSNNTEATAKASILVAAAVARVREHEALDPIRLPATSRALVVGGGIGGLRAALDISNWGIDVTLLEKTERLGGRVATLGSLYPTEQQGAEVVGALVKEVEASDKITVLTGTEMRSASGFVGNFVIEAETAGDSAEMKRPEMKKIEAGAVVMATGFSLYEPAKREFGYGRIPQVITLPDFLDLLRDSGDRPDKLLVEGEEIRRVGFIHCVGSRQIEGVNKPKKGGSLNTHCSRVCCSTTLRAANELKEKFPALSIYDFYRDIRTYGPGQEAIYEQASKNGVIFLRYEPETPPKVTKAGAGDPAKLLVTVKDSLTWGEEVEVPLDLVVLSVGMEPADITKEVEALKLSRGQDGFLQEVHPKLRPVETAVAGIVLAGTCQSPRDITETCASASAAAIKVAGILTKGHVELEPYVAKVDLDRCDGTGVCVNECEYDGALVLQEVEVGGQQVTRAVINEALCVGCGCCVAVCPTRAIDVNGWTLDQFEAMVDSICAADLSEVKA
jgi:heterodisulfide reductase subunit A2